MTIPYDKLLAEFDILVAKTDQLRARLAEAERLIREIREDGVYHVRYQERMDAFLTDQPSAAPRCSCPFDRKRFESAPCYICGYNGPGYFQTKTHSCAAAYHAADEDVPSLLPPPTFRPDQPSGVRHECGEWDDVCWTCGKKKTPDKGTAE